MGSSEGRETVPLMDYHGPRYDIAVNGKFLTDIFTTTGSENVTLHFSQESNEDPIVIVPRQEPQPAAPSTCWCPSSRTTNDR